MKKFLLFVVLAFVAGGIAYYESRPTTVKIPVEVSDEEAMVYTDPEATVPFATETTLDTSWAEADFSAADLSLEVRGVGGDDVNLYEVISEPKTFDALPDEVQAVAESCDGVTDRDMVVQIDIKVELLSDLPATVQVDYNTDGYMAVFGFNSGLSCESDGQAHHDLTPGQSNYMSYWVILRGAITPDAPDGDTDQTWTLTGPVLTLPNLEQMYWQMWGPSVAKCNGLVGDVVQVHLAGRPINQSGCYPAPTKDEAAGVTQ